MVHRPQSWVLAALSVLFALPAPAHAAGIIFPDNGTRAVSRGGAFAVRANDPTAVHHNPGALVRLRGTHLLYSHGVHRAQAGFTRAESVIPQNEAFVYGADPFAPVSNEVPWFPLGAMLAASSDFGLEDFTFGLGIYGPNAAGRSRYPVDGGQRYMLTGSDGVMVYYTASAAWGDPDHFGLGLGFSYVDMPKTDYSLVVDGTPGGALNPYSSSSDVEATLALADRFAWTLSAGGWWRVTPSFEIGASGYLVPVHFDATGGIELSNVEGQSQFTEEHLDMETSTAKLTLELPIILRLGGRYRHLVQGKEVADFEVDLVYEGWSSMDALDVDLEGEILLYGRSPMTDVTVAKAWRDTLSLRAGGTASVIEDLLDVSLGGFIEQGAAPNNYSHLDFPTFDRLGVGGGVELTAGDFSFVLAYMHIFQESRTVTEELGKVYQQRPIEPCPGACFGGSGVDGVPANAGTITSSFDTLSAQVSWAY